METPDDTQLRDILLEYHGDEESPISTNKLLADEEITINDMCRTCLSKKQPNCELKSMFSEYTYIPVFLMSFAAVETPRIDDRLPELICTKCIDQVNQIYNFRKQIETADYQLRRMLLSEPNSDDEEAIEETLETEDYSNLDDIDLSDILSVPLPISGIESQKLEENLTFDEESQSVKKIIISSIVCGKCQKTFESSEELEKHQNETHNPVKITCNECKSNFEHESDYNIHLSIHSKTTICGHCKKDCGTKKGLKRHIYTHFINKPFKCKDCKQQFSEMAALNRHVKRHHLNVVEEKKYHCNYCQQQFYNKYTLEVHIRSKHTGVKPFSCTQCEKSFVDRRLLKCHEKVHSDAKDHVCPTCKQSFKHRGTLLAHLRTHTSERPFVCDVCNVTFKQKTHLTNHKLSHSKNPKPFVCKVCNKAFTASSSLKVHERSHTGVKPYECEICKKKFARKNLRAHYSTHTGQKDFACTEEGCGKAYPTQSLLNMHRKIKHSDANPFVCTYEKCGRKFSSKINLEKHLKSHERQESVGGSTDSSNSFISGAASGDNGKSTALCVMDELDQFMKQHQQQFNTNKS